MGNVKSKTLVKDEAQKVSFLAQNHFRAHTESSILTFPECLLETIGDSFKMCSILKKTTAPFFSDENF